MSIWLSKYWHICTFRGQSKCGVKSVAKLSADILFFPSWLAVTCSNRRTSFNKTRFSVGSSRSNSCNALSRRISPFWLPGWSDEPDVPPHISETTEYDKIQTTLKKLGNKSSYPESFIPYLMNTWHIDSGWYTSDLHVNKDKKRVKQPHCRPGEALWIPGGWGSQISR